MDVKMETSRLTHKREGEKMGLKEYRLIISIMVLVCMLGGCGYISESVEEQKLVEGSSPIIDGQVIQVSSPDSQSRQTMKYFYKESFPDTYEPPNWEDYVPKYNSDAKEDFLAMSKEEIVSLLGNPHIEMKKVDITGSKVHQEEIFIYFPYRFTEDKDSTGISISIIDGIVTDYKVDELTYYSFEYIENYFD